MGQRPRGKSSSMTPARLLKPATSFSSSGTALSAAPAVSAPVLPALPLAPLAAGAVPKALEEDLESAARASLALFGFGADSVNWSAAALPSGDGAGSGAGSSGGPSAAGVTVKLMERVAPLGANARRWRAPARRDSDPGAALGGPGALHDDGGGGTALSQLDSQAAEDEDGDWEAGALDGAAGRALQRFLVKCVAVLPAAAVEEVVELLVRSDRDDMDAALQHLAGVKASGSGFVYRRRRRRAPLSMARRAPSDVAPHAQRRRAPLAARRRPNDSDDADEDEDSSASESDDEDAVVVSDDSQLQLAPTVGGAQQRRAARLRSLDAMDPSATGSFGSVSSAGSSFSSANGSWSSVTGAAASSTGSSYLAGYRRALARGGHPGRLSLKWVVGEKSSRVFGARAAFCLLDYECVLVNDWAPGAGAGAATGAPASDDTMYVRALQSCYLPQCQPWLDELGGRARNLEPAGVMVRRCPPARAGGREGLVEVQLVASILEKPSLPSGARRAKLRQLCARVARLEELITARRLSHSLLTTQPQWVRDRERPGCRVCDARFGLSRRRHHCRICGEICCSECCPKVAVALPEVGTTSVRVCVVCFHSRRRPSAESAASASSSSTGASPSRPPAAAKTVAMPVPALSPTPSNATTVSTSMPSPSPPPPPPPTPTAAMTPPPPANQHAAHAHHLSASSPSTPSSLGSTPGSFDRKPSLASAMLHKLKSSSSLS